MFTRLREKYRYSIVLLRELVRTDFKLKYQDSALGYVWSVLKPLFLFAIMYVVFAKLLGIGRGVPHWPVAMLAGIVLWQFFTDVTTNGLKTIVNNGSLLRKIKFPRYIVIISGTVSSLISLGINAVVVIVFAVINGVTFSPALLVAIPLVIEVFVFSIGVAFFLSAVYVKFRDIQHIWDILVRGLFYGSAILFPINMILSISSGPLIANLILINPVSQAIQDVRHLAIAPEIDSLWTVSSGNLLLYLVPIVISIIVFAFGAFYFKKRAPYFAEDV
ncbi:MAG: ABC transporter permease [Candidatus Nomurabacteria bacterium]|jgi:ABC-2 type transport system permease protein|nr:ABC transporter permease [Candidatus Nomurabacteria bacterium]